MGVDFLKRKHDSYQRRRRRYVEEEFRQGGLFRLCGPDRITQTRVRLVGDSLVRAGDLLWATWGGLSKDSLSLRLSGKTVAEVPRPLVASLNPSESGDGELVAQVVKVDSTRRQADVQLVSTKEVRCRRTPRDST